MRPWIGLALLVLLVGCPQQDADHNPDDGFGRALRDVRQGSEQHLEDARRSVGRAVGR